MGDERPLLNETVQTLSQTIKDLEKQLENMLEVNEALERDLDRRRKQAAEAAGKYDALKEQLRQTEKKVVSFDDLRAEVGHLGNERSRLAATIGELGQQLADAAQENKKLDRMSERMRAERDDSLEELQSVEEQFDRAMEMVTDLKARVTTLAEERDELVGLLKVTQSQLQLTEEQRDLLRSEVDESRKALEEIRREVADACMVSQRHYYQDDDGK